MTRRSHFDSGHNRPEYRFTDELHDPDTGLRKMSAFHPDFKSDFPAAEVTYSEYRDDYDEPTIEVDYLKSHDEGKGHAKALMEHMYQTKPHFINWGHTISPASTHLANQFEDKYYNRTAYYTDEDF